MAGSARTLPAIKPFKTSCDTCIGNSTLIENVRGGDAHRHTIFRNSSLPFLTWV